MYKVVEGEGEFNTLEEAIHYAKSLGLFVTIEGNGIQVCGIFGVDSIEEGKLPGGGNYTFNKKEDSLKARRLG